MNLAFIQVVIVVTYSIFRTEFDATMQEIAFLAVDFSLAKHGPWDVTAVYFNRVFHLFWNLLKALIYVTVVMEVLSFFLLFFVKVGDNFETMFLVFSSVESPHVDLWVTQKMFWVLHFLQTTVKLYQDLVINQLSCGTPWESASTQFRFVKYLILWQRSYFVGS